MSDATHRLLADIGGTNCRFALADAAGAVTSREAYPLAAYGRFEDALAAYLERHPHPAEAAIAAAGPETVAAVIVEPVGGSTAGALTPRRSGPGPRTCRGSRCARVGAPPRASRHPVASGTPRPPAAPRPPR